VNKRGILQVRLDGDLQRAFAAEVARARKVNVSVSESVVARMLLAEAMSSRIGRPITVAEQGFREGWLRGYGESRRAFLEAAQTSAQAKRLQ